MADRLRRPLPFILVSLRTRWFGVIEEDDDDGTMGRGEAGKVSGNSNNSNNNDKGVVSAAGFYFMLGSHLVTMVMHIMASIIGCSLCGLLSIIALTLKWL